MRFVFTSTSTSWKESSCRKKHRAAPSPQNHTVLLFLCSNKYLKPQWISGMHRLPGALVFCGPQQYDLWLWKCEHSFCQKKLSFSDKGNIQIPVRPVTYTVGSYKTSFAWFSVQNNSSYTHTGPQCSSSLLWTKRFYSPIQEWKFVIINKSISDGLTFYSHMV